MYLLDGFISSEVVVKIKLALPTGYNSNSQHGQ